jgi:hypothetical protein
MNNKTHLNFEGINQIINIISSMNLGLSDLKKIEFSKFKLQAVDKPKIITNNIPDPQ